jgi:hypothetical protein
MRQAASVSPVGSPPVHQWLCCATGLPCPHPTPYPRAQGDPHYIELTPVGVTAGTRITIGWVTTRGLAAVPDRMSSTPIMGVPGSPLEGQCGVLNMQASGSGMGGGGGVRCARHETFTLLKSPRVRPRL